MIYTVWCGPELLKKEVDASDIDNVLLEAIKVYNPPVLSSIYRIKQGGRGSVYGSTQRVLIDAGLMRGCNHTWTRIFNLLLCRWCRNIIPVVNIAND